MYYILFIYDYQEVENCPSSYKEDSKERKISRVQSVDLHSLDKVIFFFEYYDFKKRLILHHR